MNEGKASKRFLRMMPINWNSYWFLSAKKNWEMPELPNGSPIFLNACARKSESKLQRQFVRSPPMHGGFRTQQTPIDRANAENSSLILRIFCEKCGEY